VPELESGPLILPPYDCRSIKCGRESPAVSILSAIAIWRASPGKVRAVAGQMHKANTSGGEG